MSGGATGLDMRALEGTQTQGLHKGSISRKRTAAGTRSPRRAHLIHFFADLVASGLCMSPSPQFGLINLHAKSLIGMGDRSGRPGAISSIVFKPSTRVTLLSAFFV